MEKQSPSRSRPADSQPRPRCRGSHPQTKPHRRGMNLFEHIVVAVLLIVVISIVFQALEWHTGPGARPASVRSLLSELEIGLEMFRVDFGEYPDSSLREDPITDFPGSTGETRLSGAHWLSRALLGYDLQGPDEQARALNGPAVTTAEADRIPRKGPYIDPDRIEPVPDNASLFGTGGDFQPTGRPVIHGADSSPILYYRADPRAAQPFIRRGPDEGDPSGIYNHDDNHLITGSDRIEGWDFKKTGRKRPIHCLALFGPEDSASLEGASQECAGRDFTTLLTNEFASREQQAIRPHKSESFVLIAAGADGVYGTDDDITSFPLDR